MKFTGNPSIELGLDYHTFSEYTSEGKLINRYVLSSPVDSDKERELAEYENIKLVRNGATYRYAPEIKYDVLYISDSHPEENQEVSFENIEDSDTIDEAEILNNLDNEIFGKELDDQGELSKYASVTSAMDSLNSQILIYKSLAIQFPEDKTLYDDLISESEVQLGKLSSLITSKETSDNMAKGLDEAKDLGSGITSLSEFK